MVSSFAKQLTGFEFLMDKRTTNFMAGKVKKDYTPSEKVEKLGRRLKLPGIY